tara:strand:+ start:80 stop:286 length:207 start_codon:yes stop_codon:yes gene_type:complete
MKQFKKAAKVFETFQDYLLSDDRYEQLKSFDYLLHKFNQAAQDEKKAINNVFISLCGYSFDSIIKGSK